MYSINNEVALVTGASLVIRCALYLEDLGRQLESAKQNYKKSYTPKSG